MKQPFPSMHRFWGGAAGRGQILIVTLMLLSVLIAAVLGVAVIARREVAIASDVKESSAAIIAADAGIEEALFKFWREGSSGFCPDANDLCVIQRDIALSGGKAKMTATYDFRTRGARWIRSVGEFRNVSRAFEVEGF